jgi:uncharacterized membrane protein
MTLLVQDDTICEARTVSPDGGIVVGQAYDASLDQRSAVLWLRSDYGWIQEFLGLLPGTVPSHGQAMAQDLAADGRIIVGFNRYDFIRSTGFVWTLSGGLQTVRDYLAGFDLQVTESFEIVAVTGISDDGTVLAGYGQDESTRPGRLRSFVVTTRVLAESTPRPPVETGFNMTDSSDTGDYLPPIRSRPE